MSLFNSDLAQETILGIFLDGQYLHSNLTTKRITDRSLQLKGVDLILERSDGTSYKIDEKAQLHYLNTNLPTFALEINYLKENGLKQGWLFDSDKITEVYAFVFGIYLKKGLSTLTNPQDIVCCDVIFVNRIRLINELSKLDLHLKNCEEHSKILRENKSTSKIEHASGFNFQLSKHLAELPVNLIVKRSFLEKIGRVFKFSA